MGPIEDVRDISRIAYGFMASKALFAALNLNIFGRLSDRSKNLDTLVEETGLAANRLATLMTTCVSLGLLAKDGEIFRNAPASERFLVPDRPTYFGDYYRFQIDRQVYPCLERLDDGLRGESVEGLYTGEFADPARANDFTRGQHAGSLGPAHVLARTIDLDGRRTLLDVGGGSGAFSIALCRRHPQLTATVLDFPAVIEVAKRFVVAADLSSRIDFTAGDALTVDWPEQRDALLMSYVFSAVGEHDITALIARAWRALGPGGVLVVHDFVVNDDGTGPTLAALWGLAMLVGNRNFISLTPAFLTGLLEQQGFAEFSVQELIPEITSLLLCTRPR